MSTLAQALTNIEEEAKANAFCSLGRILETSDEEDRKALISVLQSPASTRAIHRALKESGKTIDRQSVTLHREHRCKCLENEENK